MSKIWPPEKDNQLRDLWAEGVSSAEIGRRLGITKNAVAGRRPRIGLPERPSPIPGYVKPVKVVVEKIRPGPLEPEVIEEITQLLLSGRSVRTVVFATGVTRHKVAAISAGLPKPPKPARAPKKRYPRKKKVAVTAETVAPVAVVVKYPTQTVIQFPNAKVSKSPCRWPFGHPREKGFRFCEAPSLLGKSYCPKHYRMAYQKSAAERRAEAASA